MLRFDADHTHQPSAERSIPESSQNQMLSRADFPKVCSVSLFWLGGTALVPLQMCVHAVVADVRCLEALSAIAPPTRSKLWLTLYDTSQRGWKEKRR